MFARAFSLALATLLVSAPIFASAQPKRVVSINMCTDQLLLAVADEEQIASLTQLSADLAETAAGAHTRRLAEAGLPLNNGLAEEVLPLDPDLVLAGAFSARPAATMLRSQGFRVVDLPFAQSLGDVRRNLLETARLVGQEERGAGLEADFGRALDALAETTLDSKPPKVAVLLSGLYTHGAGTLLDDIVKTAGLDNKAADWGITGIGKVSLEQLVSDPAEAYVFGLDPGAKVSIQASILAHPAVIALSEPRPHITVDSEYWICGSPQVLEAVRRFRAFAEQLRQDGGSGR